MISTSIKVGETRILQNINEIKFIDTLPLVFESVFRHPRWLRGPQERLETNVLSYRHFDPP